MTKKQKSEAYDATQRECELYRLMLGDVLADEIVYGAWFKEYLGTGKYRAGISRIGGAAGGLLVITWRYAGQRDSISVYHLESQLEDVRRARVSSEVWEPILQAILDARTKAIAASTKAEVA